MYMQQYRTCTLQRTRALSAAHSTEAYVRISSYDYARFGTVDGTVEHLSATTYLDEQELPYYRALIALEQDYVGEQPGRNRIIPGMTLQADIQTGEKTVLDYLLRPIYRGLDQAFTER